ncbi:Acrylyl-CoA reductase AcuI [compost metagenome]
MRPRGVIASVGNVGGNALHTNVLPFVLRGVRLVGVNLSAYTELSALLWSRMARDLPALRLRELTHLITLDELPQAISRMLAGESTGRTVVVFGPH